MDVPPLAVPDPTFDTLPLFDATVGLVTGAHAVDGGVRLDLVSEIGTEYVDTVPNRTSCVLDGVAREALGSADLLAWLSSRFWRCDYKFVRDMADDSQRRILAAAFTTREKK